MKREFALSALLLCPALSGRQALAQRTIRRSIAPVTAARNHGMVKPAVNGGAFYQLSSGFGVLPPLDENDNDEWPCQASWTNFNGADCSQIAYGGVVIAWPTYTWSLEQCSDDSEGAPTYCGQVFWFYEDDTGDTTDDLIATTEVKQGTNIILYVVTNFGPGADTPGDNVIWLDSAFGTQGQTGKGNGWCAGTKAVRCTGHRPSHGYQYNSARQVKDHDQVHHRPVRVASHRDDASTTRPHPSHSSFSRRVG